VHPLATEGGTGAWEGAHRGISLAALAASKVSAIGPVLACTSGALQPIRTFGHTHPEVWIWMPTHTQKYLAVVQVLEQKQETLSCNDNLQWVVAGVSGRMKESIGHKGVSEKSPGKCRTFWAEAVSDTPIVAVHPIAALLRGIIAVLGFSSGDSREDSGQGLWVGERRRGNSSGGIANELSEALSDSRSVIWALASKERKLHSEYHSRQRYAW